MTLKFENPKDQNLMISAMKRAFSRSDIRRAVIDAAVVQHSDPKRKKVKTWVLCAICKKPEAKSNMQVDHEPPVIPVTVDGKDMDLHAVLDRLMSVTAVKSLRAVCKACHRIKSLEENAVRRKRRKEAKNGR